MPDLEALSFTSREGAREADVAEVQASCSGRRHPRLVLGSPSACVGRAAHHIQEVKAAVENWCQQMDQDKQQADKTARFQDGDSESAASVQLAVEGVGISARGKCPSWSLLRTLNDVLGEVVHLVERLESDRQFAQEALGKERRRRRFLQSKLDSLSQWRQREHATAVQREREAGLPEIAQLKTQLKLERQKADEVHDKLLYTELLNQHVQEDTGFAQKQIPIVRENLKLESSHINQISSAVAEAEEVSIKTKSDLRCAEKEWREIELDANKEKTSLHNFLLAKKSQQAKKLDDLKQLKMLEENLCAELQEAESGVTLTEENCAAISRHLPEMTECENTEKDSISLLNLRIEEETQKNRKLRERLNLLQEDFDKNWLKGEAHICRTDEQLQSRRRVHAALRRENMQLQQNVDDHHTRILQSETSVKLLRETRKQMVEKTSDNQRQFENAKQEVNRVAAQHRATSEELEENQRTTDRQEQKMRTHIEALRVDLSGQVSSQQLLKARCESLNEEVKLQQRSFLLANQQLLLDLEDMRSASEALNSEVKELKTLRERLTSLQSEHKKTLVLLESQESRECETQRAAQGSQCELMERRENSERRIAELLEKTAEYNEASDETEKTVHGIPVEIRELQCDLDVLELRNGSARLTMETLQSQIHERELQTRHFKQMLSAQVTVQRQSAGETWEELKAAVKENNFLAFNYRRVMKILEKVKQESTKALSLRSRAHHSFLYFRKLLVLQARMHEALVSNLKRRSLIGWTELDRCFVLSTQKEQSRI